MDNPIIQTTNLSETFRALRNSDPLKIQQQTIESNADYKRIPRNNYAPIAVVNTGQWGGTMSRTASVSTGGTIYGQPGFFSPVHTSINWQIPSKRIEQYQWARFFYENEPKVGSSIDFYAQFPMSDWEHECRNRKVKLYFDKMKKKLKLNKWCRLISHEVHLLGDCFPFVEIDCPHCFPKDTMILTQNGHKAIQDIKVDDSVLTYEGSYESVIQTMSFKYNGEMVEITPQSIPSIKSTSDHKHYIIRPEYRDDNRVKHNFVWGDPVEMESKDIQKGDYIACPFNNVLKSDMELIPFDGSQYRFRNKALGKKMDIVIDEDFARLMGWYVAEGSTDSNRTFNFTLGIDEQQYAEQIKMWMEKYFKQGSTIEPRYVGNVVIVNGYSREISAWFDEMCGHGAKNKRIPYFIMRGSKSVKKAFLESYLLGDGAARKSRNENTLTTVSRTLCYDLIALLADIGAACYVCEKEECIDNLGIHRCHSYSINYRIETKRENGQGTHKEENKIYFKVKDVIKTKELTTVYNFTVNNNHNYVANFCHTKNCGGGGKLGSDICEHEGGTVRRIVILNPDYVEVLTGSMNPEPIIALRPDEELINMVHRKTPGYEKLSMEVIKLISAGQPIRLDNRNVFHLKYGESGYQKYGIGMVRRLFPILSYKTKLMVAQWIVAERLIVPIKIVKIGSDERPAGPADIAAAQAQLAATANDPNLTIVTHHAFELDWVGACYSSDTEVLTENGWKKYSDVYKNYDEKIATYNLNKNCIEYQIPSEYHEYDYDGEICHFESKHYDAMVTPNHRMLVQEREWNNDKNRYDHSEWKVIRADQVIENTRFKTTAGWNGYIPENLPYKLESNLRDLSLHSYLSFVGYYLSEGGLKIDNGVINSVHITQKEDNKCFSSIKECFSKFSCKVQMSEDTRSVPSCWQFIINNSEMAREIARNYGENSSTKSIPKWIKNLPNKELCVLLNAMMEGDGSVRFSESGKVRYKYTTVSKKLADDVQEIVLKLGYDPKIYTYNDGNELHSLQYIVFWSHGIKESGFRSVKDRNISREKYTGKVWCFTVPNGFFITRRNGKISIQGNSGKILTLSNEFEFINQEILDGMMINNALLNGEGPNFSSAAVGIEAMIKRLKTFRQQISEWMLEAIYVPEALRQGFVEKDPETGEDEVIVPELKWDNMHLRDQQQDKNFAIQLYEKGLLSAQTVLEMFEYDADQELERKRYDSLQMVALGQGGGAGGGGGGMGGGGGGMPPLGGGGGGPGGEPPIGAPGGEMGGPGTPPGAPPSPTGMGGPSISKASSMSAVEADPGQFGGMVLKKRTRERIERDQQRIQRIQEQHLIKQQKAQNAAAGGKGEMRDEKGRIMFTGAERKLIPLLKQAQKDGLLRDIVIYPQFRIQSGDEEYVIDFAIPNLKIGIEADGEIFHSAPKQVEHDKERDNLLAQQGWIIKRFLDKEIEKNPQQVVQETIKLIMQKQLEMQTQASQAEQSPNNHLPKA